MRPIFIMLGAFTLLAATPSLSFATETVFTCHIGGKWVSVSGTENRLTYRFGAQGKAEIEMIGSPAAQNIFKMTQRFAGMAYQLRFTRGDYSYIVYSVEGNTYTNAAALSGVVVMRGTKRLYDRSCRPFAAVSLPARSRAIPEDDQGHSVM